MPTIDIHKQDLEELVGRKFTVAELEEVVPYFKGEIEEVDGHNLKLEIKSKNVFNSFCVSVFVPFIFFTPLHNDLLIKAVISDVYLDNRKD